MTSNKHADLKQIRSKCYPEDISKDKGKKANFRKSSKDFKTGDGYLTYKGKRRAIFDNDRRRNS